MSFTVLIPARLASTRLPRKALADIGGAPMVVRVAQQAAKSRALQVVVATDHDDIAAACQAHGVQVVMTASNHATGSDRLAEACALLSLDDNTIVVNVQGDEPLIDPGLINACAALLADQTDCVMGTVGHPISNPQDLFNPNVVKLVCNARQQALYFSRAPIPWWRDGYGDAGQARATLSNPAPLRHVGLYSYRAGFLRSFPLLAASPLETTESLEQLRVLWHGHRIAVHISAQPPGAGVDTPEDLERVRAMWPPTE
jgi:3-deoxy-manno-octulosonate cytidylyltransferase (CMP-KDO synthetase)